MRIKGRLAAIRVLSNPIAYRIVAAIGVRGAQTTAKLARTLDDVPTSSLYRQLARLRDTGVLQVTGERQARGAVERTYALSSGEAAAFTREDIDALPISQLRATFRNFIATMVADISAYVETRSFARNRSQTQAALAVCKLTDSEYLKVIQDMNAVIAQYKDRSETPQSAKRRSFYMIAVPEAAQ